MKRIRIITKQKQEYIDITEIIRDYAKEEFKDSSGIVTLFVPHTTSGVFINEGYDNDVVKDINKVLNRIVEKIPFDHIEGNSDAHSKSVLTGNSIQVIVENGELMLGRWQSIFFAEFDGPRERELWIKAIKD
ncbi:MAG: hypothetical protein PWP03_137 [Candidatus Woesearchaeota archaeon]|nr:hypothetical protein [Candidatus Woesearchaeota archaeon]MDN5327499.1 hypothetical protein [Candidatus Woesearchaeota archaeon]